MNPMKRLGLVVLVFILGAMFATSPVLAGKPGHYPKPNTVSLIPPEIDPPEPRASGKCIFELSLVWPGDPALWFVDVTVTCTKLTPGEQYHVWFAGEWEWGSFPITADGRGKLSAQFGALGGVYVWVENDGGAVVLHPAPYH